MDQIKINRGKCLIQTHWSLNRIHSFLDVPKGRVNNMAFFAEGVMSGLIENITAISGRKRPKRCAIHRGNTCLHSSTLCQECIRSSKGEQLLYPASSPDVDPNNFFLFGHMNGKMYDCDCASPPDLLKRIVGVFSQIGKAMLIGVFESWIKQLHRMRKHERSTASRTQK
jgi:hypothetical protein